MPELVCTCLVVSLVTRDRLHLLLHPPLCPHLLLLTTRQLGTNIYISYGASKYRTEQFASGSQLHFKDKTNKPDVILTAA